MTPLGRGRPLLPGGGRYNPDLDLLSGPAAKALVPDCQIGHHGPSPLTNELKVECEEQEEEWIDDSGIWHDNEDWKMGG